MLQTLGMTEGVWVALITAGGAVFAALGGIALKAFLNAVQQLATIAVSSVETRAEVKNLKTTISSGLDTQTREIGRVVQSVDKLTHAVDEHSQILREHDERLKSVENAQ